MDVTVTLPPLALAAQTGVIQINPEPIFEGLPGLRPFVREIAAVLRARTVDNNGNELGEFTDETRPTSDQVEELITGAVADVQLRVSEKIPEKLWPAAREAVVLRTAMAVERGYWPEQASNVDSTYELFRKDYLELVEKLVEAVADPTPGKRGVYSIPITTAVSDGACFYEQVV